MKVILITVVMASLYMGIPALLAMREADNLQRGDVHTINGFPTPIIAIAACIVFIFMMGNIFIRGKGEPTTKSQYFLFCVLGFIVAIVFMYLTKTGVIVFGQR